MKTFPNQLCTSFKCLRLESRIQKGIKTSGGSLQQMVEKRQFLNFFGMAKRPYQGPVLPGNNLTQDLHKFFSSDLLRLFVILGAVSYLY